MRRVARARAGACQLSVISRSNSCDNPNPDPGLPLHLDVQQSFTSTATAPFDLPAGLVMGTGSSYGHDVRNRVHDEVLRV